MESGRAENDWMHTADVLAMLAEINRNRKKRSAPFRAIEFNRFEIAKRRAANADKPRATVGVEFLKEVFGLNG